MIRKVRPGGPPRRMALLPAPRPEHHLNRPFLRGQIRKPRLGLLQRPRASLMHDIRPRLSNPRRTEGLLVTPRLQNTGPRHRIAKRPVRHDEFYEKAASYGYEEREASEMTHPTGSNQRNFLSETDYHSEHYEAKHQDMDNHSQESFRREQHIKKEAYNLPEYHYHQKEDNHTSGIYSESRNCVHSQRQQESNTKAPKKPTVSPPPKIMKLQENEEDMEEAYRLHREKLSRSIRERKLRSEEKRKEETLAPTDVDQFPVTDIEENRRSDKNEDLFDSNKRVYEETEKLKESNDSNGLSCLAHYLLHIKTLKPKSSLEEMNNKGPAEESILKQQPSIKHEALEQENNEIVPQNDLNAPELGENTNFVKNILKKQQTIQLSNYINEMKATMREEGNITTCVSAKIPFFDGSLSPSVKLEPQDTEDGIGFLETENQLSEEPIGTRMVATDTGSESRHLVITTHFKDVSTDDIPDENRSKKEDISWFCKVCDMKVLEEKITHLRTAEHKKKKKWQRPYCDVCDMWFRHPRQLVQHVKTPDHKSNVSQTFGDEDISNNSSENILPDEQSDKDHMQHGKQYKGNEEIQNKKKVDIVPEGEFKLDIPHIIPVTGYYCDACCDFFFDEGSTLNHCKSDSHKQKVSHEDKPKGSESAETTETPNTKKKATKHNGAKTIGRVTESPSTKPLDWNFVIPKLK
uniref:Zn-finger (U1-like)-11 isoform X2 n=1 Tax=Ciona intestinalis TaxID=7719 RepID=UPI000521B526|nr:Zn-finger (U1-like)-11 isoform X2 [Ciona intestinalis]|eukprot:XP_009859930.1 Zn-finger (U1-like)-11 isoform X2 [Ciona intestinalis]